MKSRTTFEQILVALAPQSIQVLEHEARTAAALAVTYPGHEGVFRAIESEALRQIFRIVVHESRTGDSGGALGSGENHSNSVPPSIVYEDQVGGFHR